MTHSTHILNFLNSSCGPCGCPSPVTPNPGSLTVKYGHVHMCICVDPKVIAGLEYRPTKIQHNAGAESGCHHLVKSKKTVSQLNSVCFFGENVRKHDQCESRLKNVKSNAGSILNQGGTYRRSFHSNDICDGSHWNRIVSIG